MCLCGRSSSKCAFFLKLTMNWRGVTSVRRSLLERLRVCSNDSKVVAKAPSTHYRRHPRRHSRRHLEAVPLNMLNDTPKGVSRASLRISTNPPTPRAQKSSEVGTDSTENCFSRNSFFFHSQGFWRETKSASVNVLFVSRRLTTL